MSIKTVHQIRSTRTDSQFNFSEKQIVSIVEEVCNGLTRKEACIKYGIAYGTIGQWMKRYNPGVSDITYIRLISGFIYLSLITDAYSKKVVGFNLHKTLATEGCITALQMALENRINKHLPLIHHSDRGCQYCCKEYVDLLCQNNIAISMTNNGDPYENAIAERLNGILKTEFNLYGSQFNYEQTYKLVKEAIANYNEVRPHASCDYLIPNQAHSSEGQLKKRWKNYYNKQQ